MTAELSLANRRPALSESLLSLAPLHLPNYRTMRYAGDDLCVALESLAEPDQRLLRHLYQGLTDLLYLFINEATGDDEKWRDVTLWTQRNNLDTVIDEVRALGLASYEQSPSELLAKSMHDVRGGALSPLLGRLQILDRLPKNEAQLQTLFVLVRDHLKIMRNAIVGLDEERRNADRKPKVHAMKLMLEKWHQSVVGPMWRERSIQMEIDSRYDGPLTECCLESAAIDRIFYNLSVNACRYALGERLEMVVFPLDGEADDGGCLRFVLSNEVSEEEAANLRRLAAAGADSVDKGAGQSLLPLFEPTVSSTGSGFGLTVVADFVGSAFGLQSRTEALRERYVGAVLDGNVFRAWFHWPKAHEGLPPKLDDFHRPNDSLSEP